MLPGLAWQQHVVSRGSSPLCASRVGFAGWFVHSCPGSAVVPVSACITAVTSSFLHAFAPGAPGVAVGVAVVLELVALPPER
eukprot:10274768-Alexandrium_andersonii.AAC.1